MAAPAKKAPGANQNKNQRPGIVICDPVTVSADPAAGSFGCGCALWLQMNVGGQPQLGRTPLWGALARARSEMARPDLQLSYEQASRLASILGVTHAATGTLRGSGPRLTLTYRLLQEPLGTSVGTPITLIGTQKQIAAGLPQIARTLARMLGGVPQKIPTSTGLTPADLALLGQVERQKTALTDEQQAAVETLAAHSSLAGLMALSRGIYTTNAEFNAAVKTLLALAGDNALVWGEIAQQRDLALLPHAAELAAFAARCPGNYSLAVAETFRYRAVQDRRAELQAATRVIKDAPRNPDGWLTYSWTVSEAADDIRRGRVYDALTPAEALELSRLYSHWDAAAQRAVQLDPAFAKGWARLAEAATFNSDPALADHALQTALALSEDKAAVYDWALEMYQPKWGGDPAKLSQFAHLAAADTTMNAPETVAVSRELFYSGSPDLRKTLLNNFIVRRRSFLATHPNDGQSHWDLAAALESSGDTQEALTEYRTAAALLPENAAVRSDIGSVLYAAAAYDQAIAQFQEAVKLDPDDAEAYSTMAYCHKNLGHYEEAKDAAETALRLNPAQGGAYAVLGEVLLRQNNPAAAVPNYQSAIRFGEYSRSTYENLVTALDDTKQWDTLLATGEADLRIYTTQKNGDLYNVMANACLEKKEWNESLALSQAALALNADDPYAHENIAEADLGLGKVPDAQAEWRKVLTYKDEGLRATAEGYLKKYP